MKTLLEDLNDIEKLSDRELLIKLYGKVSVVEEGFSDLKETIYGDEAKKVLGLKDEVSEIAEFVAKYKKWEFALGVLVGFFAFIWGAILGIKEIFS